MPRPVSNPPNPWHSTHVEWLEEPPAARLTVYEEEARSVVTENQSPDVSFRYGVNPYRGCQHGCAYCYARPTHGYLDFGAGTDFERRIVVKTNAPELLARELTRPALRGETIVFSGNTDCYQPLEASYELTRRCLKVCRDRVNPVAITTKGALVRRDVDVLEQIVERTAERVGERNGVRVFLSIPFASERTARAIEPSASTPSRRFETLRILHEHGIPTGVSLAPLIPGLNDQDVPEILTRAREAGADVAFQTLVRLPKEVLPVFRERLAEAFPERVRKVENAIRELRGGAWSNARFEERMRGTGPRWDAVQRMFEIQCKRLGFNRRGPEEAVDERRASSGQGTLFDE